MGYPCGVPLSSLGTELVDAGYTVFVPWINDSLPSCYAWGTCSYSGRTVMESTQWAELDRWGTVLSEKTGEVTGSLGLLVPEVRAAVDVVLRQPGVDFKRAGLIGWDQGAWLAGVVAALDPRIGATVWLGPPVDFKALASDPVAIRDEAACTLLDCAFGQPELAALIAPRPLLLSFSTSDPTYRRIGRFVSEDVYLEMAREYHTRGADRNLLRKETSGPCGAVGEGSLGWLNETFHYHGRPRSGDRPAAPSAKEWPYPQTFYDYQRNEWRKYLAALPATAAPKVQPDFTDVRGFERSVEPFRQELRRAMLGDEGGKERPIEILERRSVPVNAPYTLEWIRIRGRIEGVELAGWLATPIGKPEQRPAVLSLDNNYNIGWLFGLVPAPFPYLNAYGDRLAQRGYVVLAPYLPSFLVDGWAAIVRAKSLNRQSIWSYLLPLYMSGADLLSVEPNVDPKRIAVYGLSFSGVAALYTMALDTRISALVFSNSVIDMKTHSHREVAADAGIWQTEVSAHMNLVQELLIAPRRFIRETGDPPDQAPDTPLVICPIQRTYERLGVGGQFELVRHHGGHQTFGGVDGPYDDPWEGFDIFSPSFHP